MKCLSAACERKTPSEGKGWEEKKGVDWNRQCLEGNRRWRWSRGVPRRGQSITLSLLQVVDGQLSFPSLHPLKTITSFQNALWGRMAMINRTRKKILVSSPEKVSEITWWTNLSLDDETWKLWVLLKGSHTEIERSERDWKGLPTLGDGNEESRAGRVSLLPQSNHCQFCDFIRTQNIARGPSSLWQTGSLHWYRYGLASVVIYWFERWIHQIPSYSGPRKKPGTRSHRLIHKHFLGHGSTSWSPANS